MHQVLKDTEVIGWVWSLILEVLECHLKILCERIILFEFQKNTTD